MFSNNLRLYSLAILVTVGLAACDSGQNGGARQAADVGVVTVRSSAVPLTSELSGRTSPYRVAEIRPQVTGIITKRFFTEGSTVEAGDPLYQIDPATYRATFDSARATAAAARVKAQRYAQLLAANAISKQDHDDAQAQNLQARAQLDMARIDLDRTRVTAPISGRIGKSTITPGALVTANQAQALTTVQQLDPIYVDVTQSVNELLALKREIAAGQIGKPTTAKVELILDDGSVYPIAGTLEMSDVTVDPGTGSIGLRAVFPNPDGTLLPGMYVRARIAKGIATKGFLVPQQAVSRDPKGNATAYVVGKNNIAEMRTLITAQTVGDKWLVTGGLKAGDKVIVEGLQMLHPGASVKASEIQTTPKGGKAATGDKG